jgi:hypothetical protein
VCARTSSGLTSRTLLRSWTLALQQAALAQKTKKRLVPREAKLKTFEMEQQEEILRAKSQQYSNDGAEFLQAYKVGVWRFHRKRENRAHFRAFAPQIRQHSSQNRLFFPPQQSPSGSGTELVGSAPQEQGAAAGAKEEDAKFQQQQRDALMKTTFLSDLASRYKFIGGGD